MPTGKLGPRPVVLAVAAVALVGLVVGLLAAPAGAAPDPRPRAADGIDPVLDAVEVRATPATRRADDRLAEAADAQRAAMLRWIQAEQRRVAMLAKANTAASDADDAQRAVDAAAADRRSQAQRLLLRTAEARRLRPAVVAEQRRLRSLAADLMVGRTVDLYEVLASTDDFTRASRRESFRDRAVQVQSARLERRRRPWARAVAARDAQAARLRRAEAAVARRRTERDRAVDVRDRFGQVLAAIEQRAATAREDLDRATATSADSIVERREARLLAPVDGEDLPLVALHAYWHASAIAPCPVPWWVLAGVGRTETRHGAAQGSNLTVDGDTTVHILGIPLDGRPGTIAVGDSDSGALDGDPAHDRAVGPMQFLPGTWGRWAVDANGDGKADPHNLYDAAAAAAGLLCYGGRDLTTPAGQRAGLLTYNRSSAYVAEVLRAGGRYRDHLRLPDRAPAPQTSEG